MARHIALLRGINLGSYRRVAMADLRELLTASAMAPCAPTCRAATCCSPARHQPASLSAGSRIRSGPTSECADARVVRSRDELADVVKRDPCAAIAVEPRRYQVSFLSDAPHAEVVASWRASTCRPSSLLSGREIFTWHPHGMQRSPLVRLLSERRLGVAATARNWNTVTKLLELADE